MKLDFKIFKCKKCGWTVGVYSKGVRIGELSMKALKKVYPKWYLKAKKEIAKSKGG